MVTLRLDMEDFRPNPKSIMYISKGLAHNTDPCGTTLSTGSQSVSLPLTNCSCFLPLSQDLNLALRLTPTFAQCNLLRRRPCGALSTEEEEKGEEEKEEGDDG